jgi:hypothetical protein
MEEFKIWARVKIIKPIAPRNQTAEEAFKKVRSFSPEVETLPSTSRSKNDIANNDPMVAKPPSRFKYLKAVLNKFIDPQTIYVRKEKVQ